MVDYRVDDAFTDADSTNLSAHTIYPTNTPVTAWTVAVGSAQIQGNRVQGMTNAADNVVVCDSGVADTTIKAVVNEGATASDIGIVFRYLDADNYWLLFLGHQTGPNVFRIYERTGGVFTQRATAAQTVTTNTDYNLQVVLSGNSMTGTINGGNSINYSSSVGASRTKHGLYFVPQGSSATKADNFRVV